MLPARFSFQSAGSAFDTNLEDCQEIVSVKNLDFNYLSCNKACLELLKLQDESEIRGKNISEVLSAENSSLMLKQLKLLLDTGKTQAFSINLNDGDEHKIFSQTLYPVMENGRIAKILSISRDVTVDENLKLKLLNKICKLNTLLEHVPMIAFLQSNEGKYITGSQHARKFFEMGIDAYSGNITFDINSFKEQFANDDVQVIQSQTTLVKEYMLQGIDGKNYWYKILKAPVIDDNDKVCGVVVIINNIDNEKQMELQKELFLATLTHDLKNPVQAQVMSLNMLKEGSFGQLSSQQIEIVDMILESANYMKEMLNSVLATYKYDNGIIVLDMQDFDVEELIQNCVNEVKAFAKNRQIKLKTDFSLKNKNLYADSKQLRRVISNLMNNALNYAFKGSDLNISVINDGKNVIFSFENSSPEIPEDIKENIFDKYVSGSHNYQSAGIGLGLYFSRKVVEAHNGRIYLEGEGKRNKFIFEIPINKDSSNKTIDW